MLTMRRCLLLLSSWLVLMTMMTMTTTATTMATVSSNEHHRSLLEREALFNLQPFSITFTSTHDEFFATGQSSPFAMIKFEIATITGAYLESFLNGMLPQTPLQGFYKVNAVDLQVSSFRPLPKDDNEGRMPLPKDDAGRMLQQDNEEEEALQTWTFKAEVYGICKFVEPVDADLDFSPREQVEHVLNTLVVDAFDGTLSSYKNKLSESEDPVLSNIVDITVETDIPGTYEPPQEEEQEPPALVQGNDSNDDEGDKWGKTEFLLTFLMGGFLMAALGCLYLYVSREFHERRERKRYMSTGHYLDDMHPQQDDNNNKYLSNRPSLDRSIQSNSDPTQNGTDGNEELIPIAAPDDSPDDVTPRRYMNPASPFEVLYGAAFMHQDQHSVEKARRQRPSKRLSRRRKSSTDGIRPMLSIAEEELSLGNSFSTASTTNAVDMPMLSTWINKLTGGYYFGGNDASSSTPSKTDNIAPQASPTGVSEELGLVYRDFPRHDGTPCLMYSPTQEDDGCDGIEISGGGGGDGGPMMMQEVYIDEGSYHSTGSMLSADSSSSGVVLGEVDNFVLQLEHLMILRQKQYQERVRMEQERKAFKESRLLHVKPSSITASSRRSSRASASSRRSSRVVVAKPCNISAGSRKTSLASAASSVTTAEELDLIEAAAIDTKASSKWLAPTTESSNTASTTSSNSTAERKTTLKNNEPPQLQQEGVLT